ncbi:glycoside hydrolase family 32 protein [Aspergillus glaucus CBS 516.65]|uniref:Glycosyl hydrolase family 32 N-terminal domain-containing protein n=1 Tax=Aspergillus glaucus CBS 516.65 TaxID=1160497 RepID=A0A1L9VDG6_ASPGL|nr:hypothetical protein ASPGLDRAFT_131303 [Aspergillus glaucus CBS 516.65]OJJ81977.1 hypothetical protein ASPGLDRAFT_131303 [Aspergillus glaucus CBS 516.65]
MTAYQDKSRHQRTTKPAWRPTFHLTAPHGWLNDPCGLGYDPTTGLYHLSFQWNPKENDWGNISWGHSVSRDLVEWETSPVPCLKPSTQYDRCGVFTGCLRSTDIDGNPGALTHLYTSVGHLPIHYSLPYTTGCETLSMAVSRDGGKTWKRPDCNPILPGPPEKVNVTGWRDPYISSWPTMCSGSDSDLYGFISGGIAAKTPTVFVYSVNPKDLREWKYIGPLVDVGLNFQPSRWSGDFGVNWEVATLATLSDDEGTSRDFVVVGTEGCKETGHQPKRAPRGQLWMSVNPRPEGRSTSGALTTYGFAGIFDHGCFYAANAFFDPVTRRQIVYGWIMEEDLPDALRHPQGWSGLISLPRVMSLMTLRHVKRARRSELKSITSIETEGDARTGTCTIRTLGVQPDPRLEKLRANASRRQTDGSGLKPEKFTLPLTTSKWELDAEFAVGNQCTSVGVEIDHGDSNYTTLTWTPSTETFQINRPNPMPDSNINNFPEKAPHTLFTTSDPETGTESEEPLRIHAYFDMSVLEIFVNDRTVISTRVYPLHEQCAGVRFFGDANTTLLRADVWDGLGVMH